MYNIVLVSDIQHNDSHSSILAWRISWTKEPGRLQSTGTQRVEHRKMTTYTRIIDNY